MAGIGRNALTERSRSACASVAVSRTMLPVDDGSILTAVMSNGTARSFASIASTCAPKHESAASSPITADSVIATTWFAAM